MKSLGKIAVVGANQGALVLAELLGKAGFSVTVFEKKARTQVGYDWHDNMAPATFGEIGLPMPPENVYFKKKCWTFVPPKKGDFLYVDIPEDKLDISVKRKPLNDFLYARAAAVAQFRYETEVCGATTEKGRVTGVITASGEKLPFDLVVDFSGAKSVIRAGLPAEFGIEKELDPADAFFVYRAIYDLKEGVPAPKYCNQVYMKHMGEPGIAWFIYDGESRTADVLVGRVGGLSAETLERALSDLRGDNPQIGDVVLHGGQFATIPVRQPISKMVAPGYVAAGDSAFMTIPMMGSGIACGMYAAKILADVLTEPKGDAFSVENLYRYQVRYMKKIGAKHSGVNMMKNWMLATPSDIIDFFMMKRIIGEKELSAGGSGQGINLTKKDVFQKVLRGFAHLPTLLDLKSMTDRMKGQMAFAAKIPEEYDEKAFQAWQKQYDLNAKGR